MNSEITSFLRSAALFPAIGAAGFAGLAVLSASVPMAQRDWRMRMAAISANLGSIDAITVGTSHATLEFDSLELRGANANMGAGSAGQAYRVARGVAAAAEGLQVVFMDASYGIDQRSAYPDDVPRKIQDRVLAGLASGASPWRRVPIDRWVALVVRPDHWRGVWAAAARLGHDATVESDSVDSLSLRWHAMRAVRAQNRNLRAETDSRPAVQEAVYATLTLMARELAERNVRVVWFTPPYYRAYVELLDPELIVRTRAFFHTLAEEHANAVYVDFGMDSTFATDPRSFRNADHLSNVGRRRFSALLRDSVAAALGIADGRR